MHSADAQERSRPAPPPPIIIPPAPSETSSAPPKIVIAPPPQLTPEQRRQQERDRAEYEAAQERAVREERAFGLVTLDMDQLQVIVLCDTIAGHYLTTASSTGDEAARRQHVVPAWQLRQRTSQLAEVMELADPSRFAEMESTAFQAIGLMSYFPSPEAGAELRDGPADEGRVMFVFMRDIAARCDARLDTMGINRVTETPPEDVLHDFVGFRYFGQSVSEIFASTQLAPWAAQMCRARDIALDFTDAPLEQRGEDGMSLLDWAMECDDRAAFDALIAAGADLETAGLYEDPPLVRSARERRLWYLERLLDAGVAPDAMGRSDTALREATNDLDAINFGGDTSAAYNLLRERGASLNFPDFNDSMWYEWGLHETRWDLILSHWEEFDSDPVELASLLEGYLSGNWAWAKKEHEGAARAVMALLVEEHGVCFPVENTFQMPKDERGFLIQPDCPKPQ